MSTGALELRARSFLLRCRLSRISCNTRKRSQHAQQRRSYASHGQESSSKPFYVTSPIFYVNAEPHAGHLYTLILTDVLKRWQVLKGDRKAALLTGTDEHGMKIQKAAKRAETPTKAFCDLHSQQFLQLAKAANISYDRFIRTTDQDHKSVVAHVWKELQHRDYIYESKHEGWYSVSDETFYPQSQVHLILDPATGRKLHASMETGKEVEWTSETNYHFRLSYFRDRLLEHYRQNPSFIVPVQRMNFIQKEVESGLQDLSISRPTSRLEWGIRVPDDESQTIYVWLDALFNYLTMTGYPFQANPDLHALWPPNVQVIGKDIIRFHTIYWPAFLMALDLPLPKSFLTHAHWTMGNAKMSKSLGNGVNPFFAMDRYDRDTIRYFMTHDGGIVDDADYDNSYIVAKYKKGLQGGLGNLLNRLTRSKLWKFRDIIEYGKENASDMQLTSAGRTLVESIDSTVKEADCFMEEPNPRQSLRCIMDLIYETNKFFHASEPWKLLKEEDKLKTNEALQALYINVESLRISCILLQPFMPDKMKTALDLLGVSETRRSFADAKFGSDFDYGDVSAPDRNKKDHTQGTLFPPLATEF